eukprot:CAMPEP_0117569024 /NCGR_PEP_ID=MMETSP0784-20121206/58445_1 /TAXON_ID=39447 /ORGANISM="" /LENGTH=78 /DNA_ID=CAMNT_0005366985 /DNA_START=208 /DNA_END=444 /DNA_ORIENTATION=+
MEARRTVDDVVNDVLTFPVDVSAKRQGIDQRRNVSAPASDCRCAEYAYNAKNNHDAWNESGDVLVVHRQAPYHVGNPE